MKRLFIIILLALSCASPGSAQNKSKALLLEAHMLGVGMTSPRGNHLYLRVYNDGRVEYEDERMNSSGLHYFIRRAKLSALEINSLSDYVNGPDVRALSKDYQPLDPPLDHAIELTVSITHADHIQTVVIRNFSPTSPRAGETYQAGLIELLCRMEGPRKSASFGITADVTQWCKQ